MLALLGVDIRSIISADDVESAFVIAGTQHVFLSIQNIEQPL